MQEQDKNQTVNTGPAVAQAQPAPEPQAQGIVSVNSRGGSSDNMLAKVIFVVAVLAVVAVGALMGFNKWRAKAKADQSGVEQVSKAENKPAAVGSRRQFDTDPPPLPNGAQPKGTEGAAGPTPESQAGAAGQACADGMPGVVMIGQDGKPLMSPAGTPMRVCKDGRVMVPAVQGAGAQPVPLAGGQRQGQAQGGTQPASRYAGDVIVAAPNALSGGTMQAGASGNPNDPMTTVAMVQSILAQQNRGQAPQGNILGGGQGQGQQGAPGAPGGQPQGANPPGSLGSLLTPSQTPMVQAGMLGDRNMILPKGRTVDCGMSMRLVNEVAGMASCVLSQNVYSDNGRVLLLERGSEATGEYVAAMAQGQRRLFVLWTRIKTPAGVVINLNSPAADALGTSGMDGYVDNHWWERLGAAFLLSMVQDAIAYETAKSTPPGGTNVYQQTASTGNRMAEKVLDSTINIKPTLYKNQGDRGSIYVARDLDFGTVYALRAR